MEQGMFSFFANMLGIPTWIPILIFLIIIFIFLGVIFCVYKFFNKDKTIAPTKNNDNENDNEN